MALLPLASSSVTVRREMVVYNNQTVSRIEGAANSIMQRTTDGPSLSPCFRPLFVFADLILTCLSFLFPCPCTKMVVFCSAIISWLSAQLAKQKKIDFKPRNDDSSFARVNTEPCVACCDFLEKVRDVVKQSLTGKNQEVFLTEIGVAFHRYVFHHHSWTASLVL